MKRNARREGDARITDKDVEARAKDLIMPTEDEPFDYLFYGKISNNDFEISQR